MIIERHWSKRKGTRDYFYKGIFYLESFQSISKRRFYLFLITEEILI